MGKAKPTTWIEYINTVVSDVSELSPQDLVGVEKLLRVHHIYDDLFSHSIPVIYVLDYSTGRYLTVSKATEPVLGYTPDNFLRDGVSYFINHYQKDDLQIFNSQIFPDRLRFLKTVPPTHHGDYIFSYNYRMKRANGSCVNLLQRNCFIKSDVLGNPILSLGIVLNIEHFKNSNPAVQVIEKLKNTDSGGPEVVFQKSYFLHGEDRLFSNREKEILCYMADGLTSKEIGQRLYISEATVINHRKNMLQKSGQPNVAALMAFALRHQII